VVKILHLLCFFGDAKVSDTIENAGVSVTLALPDKFFARFYMEPLSEGVLLYSVSGADVSDFVAKQVDMPSAVTKRLRVITGWVIDGLKGGTS
jgi:hypothetical protein